MRNFEWELVDPIPEPNWAAMVIGPLNGRVKYTPRKLVWEYQVTKRHQWI